MRSLRRTILFIAILVACSLIGFAILRAADDETRGEAAGSIAGTIRYRYDSKRWWRYGRYYVRGKEEGELGEAIVALADRNLERKRTDEPATATIDQKDFRFVPETIAIRAGDRVQFTNSDRELHNVSSSGALQAFDVSLRTGGESAVTFDRAGNTSRPAFIGCKFHSQMHAWIYVFDHPYYRVTAADGRYRLDGVPPGEHRLEILHPAGGLRLVRTVNVVAGQTTTLDLTLSPDDLISR